VQPDIQVAVSLDARKRQVGPTSTRSITKFKVTSKNKANGDVLFLLEVDYGGDLPRRGRAGRADCIRSC
jgi:preprotein translocase subunit SecB